MVELELAQKKGASNRTVTNGPAPVAASHQRLLSMKQSEIQERLIKNKTLLNVVEPTLTNHSLDLFLGILQRRIELDKEALFQFSQLKRDQQSAKPAEPASIVIAPILMKYSHGCQQVSHHQHCHRTHHPPKGHSLTCVTRYRGRVFLYIYLWDTGDTERHGSPSFSRRDSH